MKKVITLVALVGFVFAGIFGASAQSASAAEKELYATVQTVQISPDGNTATITVQYANRELYTLTVDTNTKIVDRKSASRSLSELKLRNGREVKITYVAQDDKLLATSVRI